jgi:hypothetical protein
MTDASAPYWIVTGHIIGEDEDTMLALRANGYEAASRAFIEAMLARDASSDGNDVVITNLAKCGPLEPLLFSGR